MPTEKRKLHQSIWLALKGITDGISSERNIKIQIVIGIVVIIASILLKISTTEMALIIFICFFVIIMEMFNTSLEKLTDKLLPEHDGDIDGESVVDNGILSRTEILDLFYRVRAWQKGRFGKFRIFQRIPPS